MFNNISWKDFQSIVNYYFERSQHEVAVPNKFLRRHSPGFSEAEGGSLRAPFASEDAHKAPRVLVMRGRAAKQMLPRDPEGAIFGSGHL